MSIRRHVAWRGSLACALAACSLLFTAAPAGFAASAFGATPKECIGTGTGAAWSYKGQKGTVYTVIGVNGASCSLGAKWLKRITTSHGTKSPAGWKCLAISTVGECQIKGGGIFEFTPKLKK